MLGRDENERAESGQREQRVSDGGCSATEHRASVQLMPASAYVASERLWLAGPLCARCLSARLCSTTVPATSAKTAMDQEQRAGVGGSGAMDRRAAPRSQRTPGTRAGPAVKMAVSSILLVAIDTTPVHHQHVTGSTQR